MNENKAERKLTEDERKNLKWVFAKESLSI